MTHYQSLINLLAILCAMLALLCASPAPISSTVQLTARNGIDDDQLDRLQPVLQCICDQFVDCGACGQWSEMLAICDLAQLQDLGMELWGSTKLQDLGLVLYQTDCGFVQCPAPRARPPTEPMDLFKWKQNCREFKYVRETTIVDEGFANGSLCNLPGYGASPEVDHNSGAARDQIDLVSDCGSRDLSLLRETASEQDGVCSGLMESSCIDRIGQPGYLEQCCSLHAFETSGFGNQVLQLSHSLKFARKHGCKVLCLPDCHDGNMDTVECGGSKMWHQRTSAAKTIAKNKTIHLMSTFNLPVQLTVPQEVVDGSNKKPA